MQRLLRLARLAPYQDLIREILEEALEALEALQALEALEALEVFLSKGLGGPGDGCGPEECPTCPNPPTHKKAVKNTEWLS